ncbi:hypothetical protein BJY16_006825 [Actinoplanes octamycinicus]|uniref:Uncharacterized protein n=1 Tax=Actinoplanes octamycinicus TaxID=135948 RepID=A0A7W7H3L7_9ACTN|nr:hypothetical protein [Actinoplanes octamycinicus]MBB4743366.1 hypothetical protein [Actinoplanes octamycinicus]GIE61881.1 hypothetical protein Aoc01nite_72830 [Actinoplanes octamycinicus]
MDPISLAIAGAVAAKGAEMAVQQTPDAWRRFVAFVRDRLSREDRGAELLTAAEADQKPVVVEALAEEITRLRQADPTFDRALQQQWTAITVAPQTRSNQATNIVTGSVGGHLVQATEISGGVSFGPAERTGTPSAQEPPR